MFSDIPEEMADPECMAVKKEFWSKLVDRVRKRKRVLQTVETAKAIGVLLKSFRDVLGK